MYKSFMQWLRGIDKAPMILLFVVVVTYLPRVKDLGFYYDDWYLIWSGVSRGAGSIIPLFNTDRPYMGYIYSLAYRLFGNDPLPWQLYAVALRYFGALAFYWITTMLLPKNKTFTLVMAILFVIYPGFLALPNANTKQNHLFGFLSALVSIGSTIKAFRSEEKVREYGFSFLGILLTANYLWIYEYMIGFEAIRFGTLYYLQHQKNGSSFKSNFSQTVRRYAPYFIVVLVFILWRFVFFESTRGTTNSVQLAQHYIADPVNMAIRLIIQTIVDMFTAVFFAWFVQLYLLLRSSLPIVSAASMACAGIISFGLFLYLRKQHEDLNVQVPVTLIVIGMVMTIISIFPVILANRQIDLLNPYKGYGLHPLPGIVLVVTGSLWKLDPKIKIFSITFIIFLSITTQFLNTNWWINFWELEKSFTWQLVWRAPDLQDNTLLVVNVPKEFSFQQGYEIWGITNLVYRQEPDDMPKIQ